MASQIKRIEDFEPCGETFFGNCGGELYRDSNGQQWLIKSSSDSGAIIEAYAANVCRLLAGDEHVPETGLVEGFKPGTQQKGYMLASKMNSGYVGIGDLQLMSPQKRHPISLDNGKISIHNHHPNGLLELIIASFIIADQDIAGNGGGNTGVDKDKAFRIDFGQAFNLDDARFVISRETIYSLFMLLCKFGVEHTNLVLFTLNPEETREQLERLVTWLQSPECKAKLAALAREYESYYIAVKKQELAELESEIAINQVIVTQKEAERSQLEIDKLNRKTALDSTQAEFQHYQGWFNGYSSLLMQVEAQKRALMVQVAQGENVDPQVIANLEKQEQDIKQQLQLLEPIIINLFQRYQQQALDLAGVENVMQSNWEALSTARYEIKYRTENKGKIEEGLNRGDFFLTRIQKRIDSFCHIISAAELPQSGQVQPSFFGQKNQKSQETKEIQAICRDFFRNYAECTSVLLPNYVEIETAACMLLWSSEPEKIIGKFAECLFLIEKRQKKIEFKAKGYSYYGLGENEHPAEDAGQYLAKECSEKLAKMKELQLQLVAKVPANAAVSRPEISQPAMG